MLPSPPLPFRLPPIAATLIGCLSACAGFAVHADQAAGGTLTLDPTAVSADAPPQNALPAVYSGGQIARGRDGQRSGPRILEERRIEVVSQWRRHHHATGLRRVGDAGRQGRQHGGTTGQRRVHDANVQCRQDNQATWRRWRHHACRQGRQYGGTAGGRWRGDTHRQRRQYGGTTCRRRRGGTHRQ